MTARPPAGGTRRARAWSEAPIIRLFTFGQSRPLGLLVLLAVFAAVGLDAGRSPVNSLRYWLFDNYQQVFPRVRSADAAKAIVVAIDEDSLARFGQWPWPRTLLARMLEQIGNANPKAIGIDLLLPESDRQSTRLTSSLTGSRPPLRHQLAALPGSDAALAGVIASLPVVIAVAGLEEARAARTVVRSAPVFVQGGDVDPYVRHFTDALSSLDAIARTARGHGLINTDVPDGVVRRPLMVASIAGVLLPSLSLDLLRVAAGADHFQLIIGRRGVQSMGYLDRQYPVNADGTLWLHFGASDASRIVSASQVLEGRVDASRFAGKIVLIGVTGLGLQDYQTTPLHTRIAGVEIHAQMVDNLVDRHFLRRPAAMLVIECVLLAVCSVALIAVLPGWRPAASTGVYVAIVVVLFASGYLLFELQHLLLDAMLPALGTSLVFGVLITGNLANADSQRRQLRRQLKDQRAVTDRMTGELEAARRIQLDMLPPPSSAAMGDPRFTLHALMAPARDVSGDLYDFFKLDADRLFFLVGDVSGKGLAACMFMAVSKALYKSAALRLLHAHNGTSIGDAMRIANGELSRDNAGMLFVTVFSGVLNLVNGRLEYCNAGHDAPSLLRVGASGVQSLQAGAGPPLCTVDDFPYVSSVHDLRRGDILVMVTDGVPEAMDAGGQLYGRRRLLELLSAIKSTVPIAEIAAHIHDDVRRFVGEAEPSDDLAVMVLQWHGA